MSSCFMIKIYMCVCVCFCIMAVLPTIPAALSAEYPACDSSHRAFQLLDWSISAKGEKNSLDIFVFITPVRPTRRQGTSRITWCNFCLRID